MIARVLLRSTDNLTVMVGLLLFQTQRFEQDWGIITAGAVLATLPGAVDLHPCPEVRDQRSHVGGREGLTRRVGRSAAIPDDRGVRPYNRQP